MNQMCPATFIYVLVLIIIGVHATVYLIKFKNSIQIELRCGDILAHTYDGFPHPPKCTTSKSAINELQLRSHLDLLGVS